MERSTSTAQDQLPQKEQRGPINQISPTPFEFKIPNIGAVCQRARTSSQMLYSEPFNLIARGYKYSLKIETHVEQLLRFLPNATSNVDLRVYIRVVPGDFDDSLSWPCKEKMRITLVDSDNRKTISRVIDFQENPYFRPLRDDHHEDRFILELRGSQLSSYIKDDTILIRVENLGN